MTSTLSNVTAPPPAGAVVAVTTPSPANAAEIGVFAGVDTHKDTHHVAVLAQTGARLGDLKVPATPAGYRQLLDFVLTAGTVTLVGIEGTNSYGAGLARFLTAAGVPIREVIRPKRAQRRRGKSDPIDAYAAAQQALAEGDALPVAKSADGAVEQVRVLLTVRRSAMKARVAAVRQLKSLLVTAPDTVRERWSTLDGPALIDTLAATRPGNATDTVATATGQALRRLARRHQALTAEITEIDGELRTLLTKAAPALLAAKGYGVVTGATLLITAGDNPDRLRSEASFAALCGAAPIPASSGRTTRYRLNRGGDRQANWALHQIALVRLSTDPRTRTYADKLRATGKSKARVRRTSSAASNAPSPARPGTSSSTLPPSRPPTTSDPSATNEASPSPRQPPTSAPSPHESASSSAEPAQTRPSPRPTANGSKLPLDTNRSIGPDRRLTVPRTLQPCSGPSR